jgi:hypothetical protein
MNSIKRDVKKKGCASTGGEKICVSTSLFTELIENYGKQKPRLSDPHRFRVHEFANA